MEKLNALKNELGKVKASLAQLKESCAYESYVKAEKLEARERELVRIIGLLSTVAEREEQHRAIAKKEFCQNNFVRAINKTQYRYAWK